MKEKEKMLVVVENIVWEEENAAYQLFFSFYAPVSKDGGAYCFTVVCLSVRLSVRMSAQT